MSTDVGSGFTVTMARLTDEHGVDIIDPIERRRVTFLTDEPVSPQATDIDRFPVPIESAVNIETTELRAPYAGHLWVRESNGRMIEKVVTGNTRTFEAGPYLIEFDGLIKVYLRFDSAFSVNDNEEAVSIEFSGPTTVQIGSRSSHTRPATTITTTTEPVDLLAAISTFGSALKTTSPERSFPTLRGHPPQLTLGDALKIPSELSAPVEDVTIEVPPTFEHAFTVAPLAYYLGVEVSPGHHPRITSAEFDHSLSHPAGFDTAVHEVLQQVFLLECATRTEGLYPVNLYERERIDARVSLDFESLYHSSVAERLSAYLEVPFRVLADVVPEWRLAAHVDPEPSSVEMLPYLANDLALVTMANPAHVPQQQVSVSNAGGFTRGETAATRGSATSTPMLVQPGVGPQALDTAWVSDGTPISATKAIPAAYENRFGRDQIDRNIRIAVICNAAEMGDEQQVVDEVYGKNRWEAMPLELEVYESVGTEELTDLLAREFNFVHYIGHIDDAGFRCHDGHLDVAEVDEVAPEAFFLNACQSYNQGRSLITAGAIGGIVTVNDVINEAAVPIGQSVARLLDIGFPLGAALSIASNDSVIAKQYLVIGDGNLAIAQPPNGTPVLYELTQLTEDRYRIQFNLFGAPPGMGAMYQPYLNGDYHYLAESSTIGSDIGTTDLVDFLLKADAPVRYEGKLSWSNDVAMKLL